MNTSTLITQIKRFGILLLFTYQTAGAELCRVHLGDDKLVYLSSYDIQPIYKDPIGPFQIESTFRELQQLLGASKRPPNIQVKIVNANATVKNDSESNKLTLNIGYRFNEKAPTNTETLVAVVSKQYAHKWISLNWNEGSVVLKEFLAEAITATYLGHTESSNPLTQIYWQTFSNKISQDVNFRRGVLLKLLAVLKINPEIQSAAELKKALEEDFSRFI